MTIETTAAEVLDNKPEEKREINFYQVSDEIVKAIAPLMIKMLKDDKKAFIYTQSHDRISELDRVLWSYGRNTFIPHVTIFEKDFDFKRQPIVISNEEDNINEADYLVFLDEPSAEFIAEFSRVFYFFLESDVAIARKAIKRIKPTNLYKKLSDKWIRVDV